MSDPHASLGAPRRQRSRAFALYILIWIVLGGGAAGYLTAMALAPDIVAQYLPAFRNDGTPGADVADVQALRESMGQAQLDIAKLRVDVDAGDVRDRAFASRLDSIENVGGIAGPRPVIEAPGESAANGAHDERPSPGTASGADTTSSLPPSAADSIKIVNAPEAAPPTVETGSVERAKASPQAAAQKPTPKPLAVHIGTAPSLDALKLTWLQLTDRHADALKTLRARYIVAHNGSEDTYTLVAGPLKSFSDGKKVCDALASDGVACKVDTFGGNAL